VNPNKSSQTLAAVLFDLDGTLIDTAPDFLYCLNTLRQSKSLAAISIQDMRHNVSHGSIMILHKGLEIEENHPEFEHYRQQFLQLYLKNICSKSVLFPGIETSLEFLQQQNIPWGIVTNKPERFTNALLAQIKLPQQPHCVVSGDTTANLKPHPESILFACAELNVNPNNSLYIGDAIHDINAAKAANMPTVLAQYGYIDPQVDANSWQANYSIKTPHDLQPLLHRLITGA